MSKFFLKISLKWLISISLVLLLILIIFSGGAFLYQKQYKGKIYPGVRIGAIELGGKTFQETEKELQKMADDITKNEIVFSLENKNVSVSPVLFSASDPSLVKEVLVFDVKGMAESAFAAGRAGKTVGDNFLSQINILLYKEKILPIYNLNEKELLNILKDNFLADEHPAKNALLKIDDEFNAEIEEEEDGNAIDYENAISELINRLDAFNDKNIRIPLKKSISKAKITKKYAAKAVSESSTLLGLAPFKLKYQNDEWLLDKKIIKKWIILNPAQANNPDAVSATGKTEYPHITFDYENVTKYLEETVAPKINITPRNAKFEIKDGKVIEFQASKDGRELELEKNYEYIRSKIFENNEKDLDLIVKEIKSDVTMNNINDMGIKETIGIGKSNFKGSPKNRRQNIATGAATLNGVLIKPEENFSLISTLGDIDKAHGYLPELVIKGNKTTPEYGGGLCQIGTTLFRTALASGLPITERQNHSYRVSYYEPAGTDATIYDPKPDMRFLNDTGKYILIQTRIEGDELIFEFWGTKDGRIVEKTEPKIYNIVKPGPTKIIETENLAVGEKKCTESSHNGADAEFNYKVTYSDGMIKDKIFKSHYKSWQAVCLIGKEKSKSTGSATSTLESMD